MLGAWYIRKDAPFKKGTKLSGKGQDSKHSVLEEKASCTIL